MEAKKLGKILTLQYGYTTWTFNKTLEDVPEDLALVSPDGGGNSLAWMVW